MLCGLLYVVFVSSVAVSIRVPNEWPKPYTNIYKPYRDVSNNVRTFPPRYSSVESVKPSRYPPKYVSRSPYKANYVYAGGWVPILPNRNTVVKTQYKNPTKEYYSRNDIAARHNAYKPKKAATISVRGSSVSTASEHELPQQIPTRPIYPGEGHWAKRGHKYRPYIRTESPVRQLPQREEPQPDGYEVFQEEKKNFNTARNKFNNDFGFETKKPSYKKYTESQPPAYEEFQPQFVPTKLYTQVRRTEKEEHVPKDQADDLRLRAVVKDSKIQTVYTEEGYEDGAYDHAGHIKEAESEEGRKRFDDKSERNGGAKYTSNNAGDIADESRYYEVKDAGKSYRTRDNNIQDKYGSSVDNRAHKNQEAAKRGNNKPWRKAQMTKDTKKSTVKNMENGDLDMEVYSEVKVMTSPSNGDETHISKIAPKKKRVKSKVPLVHKFAITEQPADISNSPHLVQKRSAPADYVGSNKGNADGSDKKYPYYKLNDVKSLDRNSALRYSEDLANIPNKKAGDMSFYNSRPNVECPEVEDSVDPIPDHIKNADEDGVESTTTSANAGGKRLQGLGDKIDCFKAKYFGENPLDSPLFREEKVLLTVPEEFKHELKRKPENTFKTSSTTAQDEEEYDEELDEMEYDYTTDKDNVDVTTLPTLNIKNEPRNIYDQIDAANEAEALKKHLSNVSMDGNARNAKEYIANTYETTVENSESQNLTVSSLQDNSTGDPVTALPLMSNRRQSNYIRNPNKPSRSRPPKIPKRRVHLHSEVEYKDDIKPSEQLHVLSDILRNIQNSTGELIQTPFPHSPIHRSASKTRNKHRRRRIKVVPTPVYTQQEADLILNTDLNLGEIETDQFMYIRPPLANAPTTTSNYEALLDSFGSETVQIEETKPKTHVKQYPSVFPTVYPTASYKNHKDSAELFDGYLSDLAPENAEPVPDVNAVPDDEEIIGLVPPSKIDYRTIVPYGSAHYPALSPSSHHYFIPGMKPPERKPTYADYESNNLKRKGFVYHRRHKRGARGKEITYTEIRRNNRKPFKFRDAASEDDSGILTQEEIDAEDRKYVRTSTVSPSTRRTTTTTTTEGPPTKSFLEFVAELKNAKGYVYYPDPTTTTTEKGATTTSTTTPVPISTGEPPEFFRFVAKLKESEGYVFIPDKKVKVTTSKPVEKDVGVEESDAEDATVEYETVNRGPVQNSRISPGFSSTTEGGTINADGEYVPKPKSYVISSIDTSKYKTINRSLMRHNLSSRYNSDKDIIASGEMNTVRIPILTRGGSSKSESVELELVEEIINPTSAKSMSAATTTPAVPTEEPIAEITTARNNKRRMWVRTQKRASTTTATPDVTTAPSKWRRGRTRIRSTTESTSEEEQQKRHVVRNRSIKDTAVPSNHKPEYSPIIPRLSSRHLNNIYAPNKISFATQKRLEEEEYVPENVEVFSVLDLDTPRHGGNYKYLNDESVVKTTTAVPRYTDVVPKPFAFFSDPALASRINQLKEGNKVLYEDLDVEDDEGAGKKKESFIINVADTDHVSEINAMKSRSFQRPGDVDKENDLPEGKRKGQPKIVAQRRLSMVPYFVKDPSKRLYYYAID